MQKVYKDSRKLDMQARREYLLSEDLMMENAAIGLEKLLDELKVQKVLILCGKGNNGADGYALARRICNSKKCFVFVCDEAKSEMAVLQKKRAFLCGSDFFSEEDLNHLSNIEFDVIVDCIFGSGFHGELPEKYFSLIDFTNECDAIRIACDVPTGIDADGNLCGKVFHADYTVTMGSQKLCLYSDAAKDFVGKIIVCDLGISKKNYEKLIENFYVRPDAYLLEENDMKLPYRKMLNTNKGTFGHCSVAVGEKHGAGILACLSALSFGAGLVSAVSENNICSLPFEIMQSQEFPAKTNAVAVGPGLGINNVEKYFEYIMRSEKISFVFDADVFYSKNFAEILRLRSEKNLPTVLTPHPKEFSSLLELTGLGKFSVEEVLENKYSLVKKFCRKFSGIVLLLKGANTFVAEDDDVYINSLGTPVLSKGGSGDVLSGMIASLLAQNYKPMEAAITASLAHSIAASRIKNNFALTPLDLIEEVKSL